VPTSVVVPVTIKLSADSSHSRDLPEVAPKYLTSCPVLSTPTVIVPIQVNAEPVKVKFASASSSVVVEPTVTSSL